MRMRCSHTQRLHRRDRNTRRMFVVVVGGVGDTGEQVGLPQRESSCDAKRRRHLLRLSPALGPRG
jgi:hypothetical protein